MSLAATAPLEALALIITHAIDIEPLITRAARKNELRLINRRWKEAFTRMEWTSVSAGSFTGILNLLGTVITQPKRSAAIRQLSLYLSPEFFDDIEDRPQCAMAVQQLAYLLCAQLHQLSIAIVPQPVTGDWTMNIEYSGRRRSLVLSLPSIMRQCDAWISRIELVNLSVDLQVEAADRLDRCTWIWMDDIMVYRDKARNAALQTTNLSALNSLRQYAQTLVKRTLWLLIYAALQPATISDLGLSVLMPALHMLSLNIEGTTLDKLPTDDRLSVAVEFFDSFAFPDRLKFIMLAIPYAAQPGEDAYAIQSIVPFWTRLGGLTDLRIAAHGSGPLVPDPTDIRSVVEFQTEGLNLTGRKLTLVDPRLDDRTPWQREDIEQLVEAFGEVGATLEVVQ